MSRKAAPLALLPVAAAAVILLLIPNAQPNRKNLPRLVAPPPDRVALQDGTVLEGEVLSHSATHTTLRLPDGTVRLVTDPSEVKRSSRQRHGALRRVTLRSGRSFTAEVLSETADSVEFRLEAGTIVTMKANEIERFDEVPK